MKECRVLPINRRLHWRRNFLDRQVLLADGGGSPPLSVLPGLRYSQRLTRPRNAFARPLRT